MTDLVEIRNDILREMYSEAEPPLDFDEVLENPEEYNDSRWFEQHYLPRERSEDIFDKHVERHDLTESEASSLSFTCIVNYGPTSVEDNI